MVELIEVRLIVPVNGHSSLVSAVDNVTVEAAERTVPKWRKDGRGRPSLRTHRFADSGGEQHGSGTPMFVPLAKRENVLESEETELSMAEPSDQKLK